MVLTLFDLDHTLLPLDTNQAWVTFLSDLGAIDGTVMLPRAAAMKARYLAGGPDPDIPFCEFFIETLTRFSQPILLSLRDRFMKEVVHPAISSNARQLVNAHRDRREAVAIITATNEFITRPIADAFGVEALIATRCEQRGGIFTGRVDGIPSMRSGKVVRLDNWLGSGDLKGIATRKALETLRFYSDSINDVALLELADDPVAVNPDAALHALATARGWKQLMLH